MGNGQGKAEEESGVLAHWDAGEDVKEEKFEEKVVHGLPNHVFQIFEKNFRILPYKNVSRQAIVDLAEHVERILVQEPTDIITKGEPSPGFYILIDGEAVVVSEGGGVVLFNINPGDFFGEISCLYGVPATARVKVPSSAILLLLKQEHLKTFTPDATVTMLDWYVRRRYLSTDRQSSLSSPQISKDMIEKRTVKTALQTWPLFSSWSDEALEVIARSHSTGSLNAKLILYPPKSTILFCGDPAHDLIMLVRGKADVVDKSLKNSMVIQARKYPFVLGEEGLFCEREHVLSVKAKTGCVVVHISKDAILEAKDKNRNGSDKLWSEANQRWQHVLETRDTGLYSKYKVYLQNEVLYKMFRENEIFTPLPIGFVYNFALESQASLHKQGQECLSESEYRSKICFMVMIGSCSLVSGGKKIITYKPADVFWRSSWMPKQAAVTADSQCLLVKVPYGAFQQGFKKFPGTKVIEPEEPSDVELQDV